MTPAGFRFLDSNSTSRNAGCPAIEDEAIGEPVPWVDVVHLCRDDKAVDGGRAYAAAIGAGEDPRLSSKCKSARRPLGGVVRKTEAAVMEKAREGGLPLEHVAHGFGEAVAVLHSDAEQIVSYIVGYRSGRGSHAADG